MTTITKVSRKIGIIKTSKKRLRVAVIGLGKQSFEDHIPALMNSRDVELIAVVDSDPVKAKEFQLLNPDVHVYLTTDELLGKELLDFAIVCVPHAQHFEVCWALLEKGIHVLKEKPISISLAEAKALSRLAKREGLHISVTLQRRFNPIYTTFFQLIDKIGTPFYIDCRYTFFTDKPGDGWRGKRSLAGGGCLIDMGYHLIDLLIWYFGLPNLVSGWFSSQASESAQYDAEDTARVNFVYKNGLWGSLLVSRVIPPKQEVMEIYGTRGFIRLERGRIERYSSSGELMEALQRQDSWPSAAQDQVEHFVKVIRGERQNFGGPDFHLNHISFVEAAYLSSQKQSYIHPSVTHEIN